MTHDSLPLPESCMKALTAIEADPMDPGPETEAHVSTCTACSEARVLYLAQEEVPEILAPAGYFERLPGRVIGKLAVRRTALTQGARSLYWAAAAALLISVGAGAFWVGRANRTPLVEATLPKSPDTVEITIPDTPFRDRDEDAVQLQSLSPDEMKALLKRLDTPAPPSQR